MSEEEIRRLRINLLRQLKAAAPMTLAIPALLTGARMEAFLADDRIIETELKHLADPDINLARRVKDKFSVAVKRYEITAAGREWLAEEGF